jgi:hypothetical protein
MSWEYKAITVKFRNKEVYKKYRLLFRLGRVVVESLLEILFEKTEIVELQNAFLSDGESGVKELIRAKMFTGMLTGQNAESANSKETSIKQEEVLPEVQGFEQKTKPKLKSDMQGFWG